MNERFLEIAYVIYEGAYEYEFFIGAREEAESYCIRLRSLFPNRIFSVGKSSFPVMVSETSDVWHTGCIK